MAAAIAIVFAGSYMSCFLEKELDKRSYEMSDAKNETAQVSAQDVSLTSASSYNSSAESKQTSSSVAVSTSPTQTTEVSSESSVTTEIITEPVTETVTVPSVDVAPPETPAPPVQQPVVNLQGAVPQSAAVGSEYLNDCAFVGDSHIKGMGGYGIVSENRVFAENGLSLAHINDKISVDSIKSVNPKHIYIMMGTNGVAWMKFSDMVDYYKKFVIKLKQSIPDADIYIISIPPVSADREARKDDGKILNSDINAYNAEILKMANDNGWYYLDVNSAIKDGNGCLSGSTDGVHMPVSTYNTFKDYILTHVAN